MGCISFSRDVPDPGIELESPALQADSLPSELPGKPHFGTSYKEGRMPLVVENKASKSWQTLKSIQGLLLLSRFNGVRLCATPQTQHTRLVIPDRGSQGRKGNVRINIPPSPYLFFFFEDDHHVCRFSLLKTLAAFVFR